MASLHFHEASIFFFLLHLPLHCLIEPENARMNPAESHQLISHLNVWSVQFTLFTLAKAEAKCRIAMNRFIFTLNNSIENFFFKKWRLH